MAKRGTVTVDAYGKQTQVVNSGSATKPIYFTGTGTYYGGKPGAPGTVQLTGLRQTDPLYDVLNKFKHLTEDYRDVGPSPFQGNVDPFASPPDASVSGSTILPSKGAIMSGLQKLRTVLSGLAKSANPYTPVQAVDFAPVNPNPGNWNVQQGGAVFPAAQFNKMGFPSAMTAFDYDRAGVTHL